MDSRERNEYRQGFLRPMFSFNRGSNSIAGFKAVPLLARAQGITISSGVSINGLACEFFNSSRWPLR